jgi:hypothetical protein
MTAYPMLRESLAPAVRRLPDASIEALVEAHGLEAEDLESLAEFWGQIGRGIQAALPTVGAAINQYGPSVAQGAVAGAGTGAAFGPWGALIGALGGGVLGGLQAQPGQRPPVAPMPMPGVPMPTPAASPSVPPFGAPAGGLGGSPAAGQLLALLARPEVMQALMAMIMGRAGASSVNVGGTQVAPGAVANLVGQLGQQAASEAIVLRPEGMSTYWSGEREDETAPESRAAEMFEVFARSAPAEVAPVSWRESEPTETGYGFREPESDYSFRPPLSEAVWP